MPIDQPLPYGPQGIPSWIQQFLQQQQQQGGMSGQPGPQQGWPAAPGGNQSPPWMPPGVGGQPGNGQQGMPRTGMPQPMPGGPIGLPPQGGAGGGGPMPGMQPGQGQVPPWMQQAQPMGGGGQGGFSPPWAPGQGGMPIPGGQGGLGGGPQQIPPGPAQGSLPLPQWVQDQYGGNQAAAQEGYNGFLANKAVDPNAPAWQKLRASGIGGQGSPEANKAMLGQLNSPVSATAVGMSTNAVPQSAATPATGISYPTAPSTMKSITAAAGAGPKGGGIMAGDKPGPGGKGGGQKPPAATGASNMTPTVAIETPQADPAATEPATKPATPALPRDRAKWTYDQWKSAEGGKGMQHFKATKGTDEAGFKKWQSKIANKRAGESGGIIADKPMTGKPVQQGPQLDPSATMRNQKKKLLASGRAKRG